MKHVVCYSGGHTSAIVGIEVARKFGKENTVLLNHDLHFTVEHADIKRFKKDVAEYIGIAVTYANHKNPNWDQFDVCVHAGAFKVDNGTELCTSRLKTEPFMAWLKENAEQGQTICYYGFDANETARIQRRAGIIASMGYRADFPAAIWKDRTIYKTEEIGIARPSTYSVFKHGNCVGCLKAGWQHWYIVFCTRPDIWLKGIWAEEEIGYAIHHDENGPVFLLDMQERFEKMKAAGVPATENVQHQTWWAKARKIVKIHELSIATLPCDCHQQE
jgi:hypothetical protein